MSYSCGFGKCFKPSWIQRFATTKYFLIVFCLLGSLQSMSYAYFVAILTTLEKRFNISSKTTGYMLSGNEVSQILLSLILTYYGGQRNRPLWLAWGVAIAGVSCFILVIPHWLYGAGSTALSLTEEYKEITHFINSSISLSEDDAILCNSESRTPLSCDVKDAGREFSYTTPLLVFMSQFVLGIGTTIFYSLGQSYIDDNTDKRKTPMFLGFIMSLRAIGPALGFMVGYFCLKVYIDPSLTPTIDSKDPRWLGAWWLGWLLIGTLMMLFSILLSMFPKKLTENIYQTETIHDSNCLEIIEDTQKTYPIHDSSTTKLEKINIDEKSKPPTLKEFPEALARLLKNKLLIINTFSGIFYILGGSGYITYITKYFEVQFQVTPADASIYIGPTSILSVTIGLLVSGIIISKFRPRPVILLSWNVIVGISFVITEILFIFISCPSSNIVGYANDKARMNIINDCNKVCNCQGIKYSPVCLESEEVTFFSACHAGCKFKRSIERSKMSFSNCNCVFPQLVQYKLDGEYLENEQYKYQHYSEPNVELKSGLCLNHCFKSFVIFLSLASFIHFLGSTGKIGNILVNYRCVSQEEKSFALGLTLLLISLLALIPGPIIYGYLIDTTCMIWNETCGKRGNCLLYDRDDFRFKINIIAAVFSSIGTFLDLLVCIYGTNLNLYEDT